MVPCTIILKFNWGGFAPQTLPTVVGSGVCRRIGRSSSERAFVVGSDDKRGIQQRTPDPTTNAPSDDVGGSSPPQLNLWSYSGL